MRQAFAKLLARIETDRVRAWLPWAVFAAATFFFALGLADRQADLLEAQDLSVARELFVADVYNLPPDQSPIYYFFLNFWSRAFPLSLAILRAPSAVFGGITVALIFLLASSECGAAGGLLAAALLTFNPMMVQQARLARSYGLVVMLTAVCMWFAYAYIVKGRRLRPLAAFVAAAVAGIYTHMFFLLAAGSLGLLFLIDQLRTWRDWRGWLRLAAAAVVGAAALLPQLLRAVHALNYAEERSTLYGGLPHKIGSFFQLLARDFFLGDAESRTWILAGFAALVLAGMIALRGRGLIAGAALFGSALGAGWLLSASTPVSTRYFVYLTPALALFAGAALARLRYVVLWGPLTAAVLLQNFISLNAEFRPRNDWAAATAVVQARRQAGDRIAVFPGIWRWAYQRYDPGSFAPFTYFGDLDRAIAGARRATVVFAPGRASANQVAYLEARGHAIEKFRTAVRAPLLVTQYEFDDPAPLTITPSGYPTLAIGGLVGSGGYSWQRRAAGPNPFDGVAPFLRSADLAIVGYAPYEPDRCAWLHTLFGTRDVAPRQPNPEVPRLLAQAGVGAALIVPTERRSKTDPEPFLAGAGLRVAHVAPSWKQAEPTLFNLKGVKLGVLGSHQKIYTDYPRHRAKGEATLADFTTAVERGRRAVGEDGRLVVVLPQPSGYDRSLNGEDQMLARFAVDLGADAVVGLGGWASKEMEDYRGRPIAHSLGTLTRPSHQPLNWCAYEGLLTRLTFPPDEPPTAEYAAVRLDDEFRPLLGEETAVAQRRRSAESNPRAESLVDRLIFARAEIETRAGARFALDRWSTRVRPSQSVDDGWSRPNEHVAIAYVLSNGQFRRALTLNPGRQAKVWAMFPKTLLGDRLRLTYGLNDELIINRTLAAQKLIVAAGDETLLKQTIPYEIGWRDATIDTSALAGQERDLTITLETSKKQAFAVAVDPVIERDAERVAALEERPYRFADHIREARAEVIEADGAKRACHGPDETFRRLRNEENGPYGEGVIYAAWRCGELPWDAAGLTLQKSGGELRPAIWLHPLGGARRTLTYGPLRLREAIEGYFGFTDLAVKWKTAPATFVVAIDGREVLREDLPNRSGWRPFAVAIPPEWRGQEKKVVFWAETPDAAWRHFCFNAWME
jgi:hypothetical protein